MSKIQPVKAGCRLTCQIFLFLKRSNAYREGLAGLPGVSLFSMNGPERYNYQYVVVEIDEAQTGVSRDLLVEILHAENVIARRYFYPGCHRMEPYRSYFPHAGLLLPETERLCQRVLILPTGTEVSEEDVREVCKIVRLAVSNVISYEKPNS